MKSDYTVIIKLALVYCQSEFWLYMSLYTNLLGVRVFFVMIAADFEAISMDVFNETIVSLALVGYEIAVANFALRASCMAICHLLSNARSWNNCYLFHLLPLIVSTELSKHQKAT